MKIKRLMRIISATLIVCFLSQDISQAAPEGFNLTLPRNFADPQKSLLKDPLSFKAPLDFCTLKDIHIATPDSGIPDAAGASLPLLIHIQDPHSNYSGQLNLAHTLEEILKRYNVSHILSEGGEGDCSLTPLKKIATPKIWRQVAKKYLLQGKIAGEEYLNLTSDHPVQIIGIENMDLYFQSVQNYAKLAKQRQEILDYLKLIQNIVDKLKQRLYPKELLDYEKGGGLRIEDDGMLILVETKN